ncbi:L-2-hydroxyglutarate oxidase [Marinibactrum halimedae]|uniref:Hydroxyglutarate oxidase n=1 Tax=Marinibactrum halimedae TaxID=1444977 RepID=A0AA37T924_9GAMM|nr:L-2-hydroxyglutarate oxidase [Marinibactrum halimedae]MCD9459664.1 L-2-hydroxyglutarate oxidase [Marinibactrum halimedae]GLS25690.1 hydroxyglutarate oxidase [Marinibactrum halimedae]
MSTESEDVFDFAIIGGGILGVSTAWQFKKRYPKSRITLIEKEPSLACHQTGHNSGVIHAGVYYQPGSFKSRFCLEGNRATRNFCQTQHLPFRVPGKLVVATDDAEVLRLNHLFQNCQRNGLEVERLGARELSALEPNIQGVGAIRVFDSGIADFVAITGRLAELLQAMGGQIRLGQRVVEVSDCLFGEHWVGKHLVLCDGKKRFSRIQAKFVVVCGGLAADRLVKMDGAKLDNLNDGVGVTSFRVVPFRGEYFILSDRCCELVNHLIYPVPNPKLPFLGVHITPHVDGSVSIGPNAVVGWKREGYGRFNVSLRDAWSLLSFPGAWRLLSAYPRPALDEWMSSWFKDVFLRRVRRYCPSLTLSDLARPHVGVRAQAVFSNGRIVNDFLFARTASSLHVCNAPSPAATAAIPIGQYLVEEAEKMLRGVIV